MFSFEMSDQLHSVVECFGAVSNIAFEPPSPVADLGFFKGAFKKSVEKLYNHAHFLSIDTLSGRFVETPALFALRCEADCNVLRLIAGDKLTTGS